MNKAKQLLVIAAAAGSLSLICTGCKSSEKTSSEHPTTQGEHPTSQGEHPKSEGEHPAGGHSEHPDN